MWWCDFLFLFKEPLPFRDIICLHVSGFCMLELIPVPLSRMTIYTDVVWWSIMRFDGETCLRFALKQFRIGPRAIRRIYNWSKEMYFQCKNRLVMSIWEFVNHFALLFSLKTLGSLMYTTSMNIKGIVLCGRERTRGYILDISISVTFWRR